jgi:hypothetical protein
MLFLRFLFKTLIGTLIVKVLGKFFPILLRFLRLWR